MREVKGGCERGGKRMCGLVVVFVGDEVERGRNEGRL